MALYAGHMPVVESWLQRWLAALHPELTARWHGDERLGQWGLYLAWPPEDPRRAMVERKEMTATEAVDLLGFLPGDCTIGQAPTYIARMLSRSLELTGRAGLRELLNRMPELGKGRGTPSPRLSTLELSPLLRRTCVLVYELAMGVLSEAGLARAQIGMRLAKALKEVGDPRKASDRILKSLERLRTAMELTPEQVRRLRALVNVVCRDQTLLEWTIAHPDVAERVGLSASQLAAMAKASELAWMGRLRTGETKDDESQPWKPTFQEWLGHCLDEIWPEEPRYAPTSRGAELAQQEAALRDPIAFSHRPEGLDPPTPRALERQRSRLRALANEGQENNNRQLDDAITAALDQGVLAGIAMRSFQKRIAFARTITEEELDRLLGRVTDGLVSRSWSAAERDQFVLAYLDMLAVAENTRARLEDFLISQRGAEFSP